MSGDGPSIEWASSAVSSYQSWELVEDLEQIDDSGGISAYGIASARELARRLRADRWLLGELDRRRTVTINLAAIEAARGL